MFSTALVEAITGFVITPDGVASAPPSKKILPTRIVLQIRATPLPAE